MWYSTGCIFCITVTQLSSFATARLHHAVETWKITGFHISYCLISFTGKMFAPHTKCLRCKKKVWTNQKGSRLMKNVCAAKRNVCANQIGPRIMKKVSASSILFVLLEKVSANRKGSRLMENVCAAGKRFAQTKGVRAS